MFHLGLSDGVVFYGYLLEPSSAKDGGFRQRSDTASKDALINYSSGQLIDRDLAYFPRITDADFSGGGYQEIWINTKQYFDADLDPRVPGFLQVRPQMLRINPTNGAGNINPQIVPFNSPTFGPDYWVTFGENNGNIYSVLGLTSTTPVAASVQSLDVDGTFLYALVAGGALYRWDGTTWVVVAAAMNGTPSQIWVIEQGTNGYFAYYQAGSNLLYKIDLTATFPVLAANQPQVPLGGNSFTIVDLCPYQSGIAILTSEIRGPGSDVWYFDGTNTTRLIRLEGYRGRGICNCLGSLYVGATTTTLVTSQLLFKIDAGTVEVVARPGSPFATGNQDCGQPRASSQFVYWPIFNNSIKGISSASGLVVQYDALTTAVTHLPNFSSDDMFDAATNIRRLALLGDNVAFEYRNATTGYVVYQQWAAGAPFRFMSSGWLVSSHIDFATPGIFKRFRRIEVHHAPLALNESIQINAFVDRDPLAFTTTLTPVPATATATNSSLGSISTLMTFGADTIGKTLYFALKLTSGANTTSPRVSYASIEVGGTWTWDLTLACQSKRQLLDGHNEDQGPPAKDLAYLLLLAYENGTNLTLYHRNGQSYAVTIESLELWNPSPLQPGQPQLVRDEEYYAHVVLRQVA